MYPFYHHWCWPQIIVKTNKLVDYFEQVGTFAHVSHVLMQNIPNTKARLAFVHIEYVRLMLCKYCFVSLC